MPVRVLPTHRLAPRAAAALAVLSAGAVALLPATPTAAASPPEVRTDDVVSSTTTSDPDDTPGRLDIRSVTHRITQLSPPRGAVKVRWTVRTYAPVDPETLVNRDRRFTVELDTDGEPGAERNVRLVWRDGRLVAEVESNATREVIATMPARLDGERALSFAGYKGLVGARKYFWYSVFHASTSPACGTLDGHPVHCQDSVPEDGWIRMDKPAWPDDPE